MVADSALCPTLSLGDSWPAHKFSGKLFLLFFFPLGIHISIFISPLDLDLSIFDMVGLLKV